MRHLKRDPKRDRTRGEAPHAPAHTLQGRADTGRAMATVPTPTPAPTPAPPRANPEPTRLEAPRVGGANAALARPLGGPSLRAGGGGRGKGKELRSGARPAIGGE